MKGGQLNRMKELEKQKDRLRRADYNLMLAKLILIEAARGKIRAPLADIIVLIRCVIGSAYTNAAPVARSANIARHSVS